jgi:hypothetical protein
MIAALALMSGSPAAHAGPCSAQIAQVKLQISQAQKVAAPRGAGEPSAAQSVGAQLHHQPTPSTVQSAEHKANAEGEAALDRAHKADAAGDAKACAIALEQVRALYGLQ